ncbi:MAG: ATP-binding protein [Hyphomicrobiaceae bacterium]
MRDLEHLFETIANFTYDGETWFDADGRPRWINPAVERMTGYSLGDCLAMPDYPLAIIAPPHREQMRALMASAGGGSSGNDVEFSIRRKDGTFGWGAISWQPIVDRQGRRFGFRTSVRDITERKTAEDALRVAKAEAERANLTKSRFLATVSHDLRQPLQAISMYVGTLDRTRPSRAQSDLLGDIRSCLQHTDELLGALLDISRLDAGAVEPRRRDFALIDLLDALETSFRAAAAEKGVSLRIVASSAFVRSDPAMLSSILHNLVSNALRYTESGRVLVGCRRRGRMLRIDVCDTGIGIAPEHQAAVFDEFYQVGNPQRDRRHGLGLGLAIVRRLSALLGTGLSLRSTPGKGSQFSVTVPLAERSETLAAEAPVSGSGVLAGRSIAIIEDEPVQLRALGAFLEACDCHVVAAANAAEILAKLPDAAPGLDAVIADYRLADHKTGLSAIDGVRRCYDHPVIAFLLTGEIAAGEDLRRQDGDIVVLHKPIEPERLINTIASAVLAARQSRGG